MSDVTSLTATIVAAFVSHNRLQTEELANLIRSVHRTLSTVGQVEEVASTPLVPAVPIKKSVYPDHIVCLEDGKKLKMLKRHLATSYNMTPDEYRAKWGLPSNYPMVAPEYASKRSSLAKSIGLGRKPDYLMNEVANVASSEGGQEAEADATNEGDRAAA